MTTLDTDVIAAEIRAALDTELGGPRDFSVTPTTYRVFLDDLVDTVLSVLAMWDVV